MKPANHWWFLLYIVVVPVRLYAQDSTKELRIPAVGWTLHIPPGTRLNPDQLDSLIEVTKKKIKPTAINIKGMQVLFGFLDTPYNGFASAISTFDTTGFLTWDNYHKSAKKQLMRLFASLRPKMEVLDTASAVEQFGGRTFERFYIKTYYPENKVTLHTYWYACPYRTYDLAINVSFSEEAVGQQFLVILRRSKFDLDN